MSMSGMLIIGLLSLEGVKIVGKIEENVKACQKV
jgi:hypothetical protein